MADSDAESFASAYSELDSLDDGNVGEVGEAAQAASEAQGATAGNELDGEPQEPFPLHRAAWLGQVALVRRLVAGMGKEELKAFDEQGNTALHVAVMRRQVAVVEALLAAGCPAGPRNARGWVPLMEAVELGDKALALSIARVEVAQMRAAVRVKKAAVLSLLRSGLPDFSLQLKWELGSSMPGVGALVRKFAPHDTYTLWKKGGRMRVDGTLMGIDEASPSLVPGWKRGHFSLLYDATGDKGRALFVNHTKKTFTDVKTARKKLGMEESVALEGEVDMLMMSEVLQHKKLKSVDFRFKPVAGWLSKEVREKVEGWNCKLYEAAGRMVAVSRYKMPYGLPGGMSYDDYLAAVFEPDPLVESPVNPLNPSTLKDRGMNPAKAAAKAAVAAKHQRIATAAAKAEDSGAAQVATAAAARAAAGALRALAPRIDEGSDEEEGEGDGEAEGTGKERGSRGRGKGFAGMFGGGGRGSGGGAVAVTTASGSGEAVAVEDEDEANGRAESGRSGSVRRSNMASLKKANLDRRVSGGGGGGGAGVSGLAQVEAAAAPPPLATANGNGSGAAVDITSLAGQDLTAWAAKVAADAAEAKAKGGDGGGGEEDDEDEVEREGAALAPSSSSAWTGGGGGAAAGRGSSKAASGATGGAAAAAAPAAKPSRGLGGWGFGVKKATPATPATGSGLGTGTGTVAATEAAAAAPSSSSGAGGGGVGSSAAAKKSRRITGRCWMAESFPLSLNQLLPLLEVVGTANKAFAKVARFMRKYGDMAMFPVKVQIPLLLTVYMLLSFKEFKLLGSGKGPNCIPAPDDAFFLLPEGYAQEEYDDEYITKNAARAAAGKEGPAMDADGDGDPGGGAGSSRSGAAACGKVAAAEAAAMGDVGKVGKRKKGKRKGGDEGPSLRLLKGDMEDDEMGLGGDLDGLDDD